MPIAIIFMLSMFVGSVAANGPTPKHSIPEPLKGDVIPKFFTLGLDNETEFNRDNLMQAAKQAGTKRIALSFFATWCLNCREEFKILQNNAKLLKDNGVDVYLISVGEKILKDGKKVSKFVEDFAGNAFPFYFDPNANLLKDFGLVPKNATSFELPITIILNENLKVIGIIKEVGYDFPNVLWGEF